MIRGAGAVAQATEGRTLGRRSGWRGAVDTYAEWTASSSFAAWSLVPLLLVYEGGLLIGSGEGPALRNSIDVSLRHAIPGMVVPVGAILLLGCVAWGLHQRVGRRKKPLGWAFLFAVESAVWALAILLSMRLLAFLEPGSIVGRVANALSASAGAGVFEELAFRLVLAGGLYHLLRSAGGSAVLSWWLALLTSALGFAAAHAFANMGSALDSASFFRLLILGLELGALYFVRGLAAAAYAHAFYDLYVWLL